jgi:para-aminobenzoate synthetase/4-amino-4-deoxychorismate lyase
MEILRALEGQPRGVYTGAVGHVRPDGSARFNVAIRTAVVHRDEGTVEFGVGSGIVWDSEAAEEYGECLLKGAVFGTRPAIFDLLETLAWTEEGGFLLLDRHIERLSDSASYFGFVCHEREVRAALDRAVEGCGGPARVRLLLSRSGEVRTERTPLESGPLPLRVRIAREPIDAGEVFLFHKTTNRRLYNQARLPDCDDTILWNRQGEVTEATMANVVIDRQGTLVTPPVECGLLAGTFRAELLARGEVREAIVPVDELRAAGRLWLVNSVHEWRGAVLCEP